MFSLPSEMKTSMQSSHLRRQACTECSPKLATTSEIDLPPQGLRKKNETAIKKQRKKVEGEWTDNAGYDLILVPEVGLSNAFILHPSCGTHLLVAGISCLLWRTDFAAWSSAGVQLFRKLWHVSTPRMLGYISVMCCAMDYE